MYKILERAIDYNWLLKSKTIDCTIRDYGLFNVRYHDNKVSSIDSDEPIDWWYSSPEEILEKHPDVILWDRIEDYCELLTTIHVNHKKLLNK